jgi:hypothetical protein
MDGYHDSNVTPYTIAQNARHGSFINSHSNGTTVPNSIVNSNTGSRSYGINTGNQDNRDRYKPVLDPAYTTLLMTRVQQDLERAKERQRKEVSNGVTIKEEANVTSSPSISTSTTVNSDGGLVLPEDVEINVDLSVLSSEEKKARLAKDSYMVSNTPSSVL